MSGIAGIIHFDGKPVESGLIEKMTSAMAHRGPDGINHWVNGSVAFGQCMLRTTPESLEEHQPLTNEDESLVLVMDGRVDNWEELRKSLLGRDVLLRNRSDAELVLQAYKIWGSDCLLRIDGDFALVIWDVRRKEAFCARDRMGNKPFNYHWNGKTFVFASELHTILALPWVKQEPNELLLTEFLTAHWYSRDETLWKGVLRLVAAHKMKVGEKGLKPDRYWEPDLWETLPYRKDEEYFEHYRELFEDSVRRLSRSHLPVAIEVSGGLDSTAVFCMAENLRRYGKLPAPRIKGYTIVFNDDSRANEIKYARAVSEYLGIQIHEVSPSILPLAWYAEQALNKLEFPGFPNGRISVGIRQKASSEGSRVTLTGEGGDAWLQGSRLYYAEALAEMDWFRLHDCFKTDSDAFNNWQAFRWLIRYGIYPTLPRVSQQFLYWILRRKSKNPLSSLYWLSSSLRQLIDERQRQSVPKPVLRSGRYGQQYLMEQLYDAFTVQVLENIEREGSHFGMEIRHPFNSSQLVQHAFSTPERLRLRGDTHKYIHVEALNGIMPQVILDRKSKAEFSNTFQGMLDQMKYILTDTLPSRRTTWVSPDGMDQLYRFYQNNRYPGLSMWILWSVYGCDCVFAQN